MLSNTWLRHFPPLQKAWLQVAGTISFLRHKRRVPHLHPTAPDTVTPDMEPQPLEGYANAAHFRPGQTVTFFLKALQPHNHLQVQHLSEDNTWLTLAEHFFGQISQVESFEEAQHGCNWQPNWAYTLLTEAAQGYYRALLSTPAAAGATAEIHFLVGQVSAGAEVVVLAPATTWLAYNAYGGQSLYRNALSTEPVSFVSALRPNTALTYQLTHSMQHNLQIEAHIFRWMHRQANADLLPDYYLEAHPMLLAQYKVVVLAYHAEYFSEKMYQTLRHLVGQQQKSLLAVGGNQAYWQVKWHQNFTQLECRKNTSFFQNTREPGRLFRHTPFPEAALFGVQYSETGMGTYAPYQVVAPDHWLYKRLAVKRGQLFGEKGIDGLPICGDETDKAGWASPKNTVVLARGLNKTTASADMDLYDPADPRWDGSGGGEIAFTELSGQHGVLATGSIQSGAGLGVDLILTGLVQNFMQKYVGSASRGTTAAETEAAPGA